jgi:hypothetical protein
MLSRNLRMLGLIGVLLIVVAIAMYLSAVYTPMPRIGADALRDATTSTIWRVAVVMTLSAGLFVSGFAVGRAGRGT